MNHSTLPSPHSAPGQPPQQHTDFISLYAANKALVAAAREGDAATVERLLREGTSPNPPRLPGNAAIATAAAWGHLSIVNMLLEAGADVNGVDKEDKSTALHNAAGCHELEILRLLLRHGANLEARDSQGLTPLHYATLANTMEPLRLLLEAGANPHARDKKGRTPLFYGVQYECPECAELLLEAGAEPDAATKENASPLAMAARWGYGELFHRLLALGADPHRVQTNGRTLLHECWGDRDGSIFHTLLSLGLAPDARDADGRSVLMATTHSPERVRQLLERGCGDINHAAKDGSTALHEAALWGRSSEAISVLLEHGANPLAQDAAGRLPLHLAVCTSARATRWLLEAGSPVNACDKEGNSVLHYASQYHRLSPAEQEEIVTLLLRHGADTSATNAEGKTAGDLADPEDLLRLLAAHSH